MTSRHRSSSFSGGRSQKRGNPLGAAVGCTILIVCCSIVGLNINNPQSEVTAEPAPEPRAMFGDAGSAIAAESPSAPGEYWSDSGVLSFGSEPMALKRYRLTPPSFESRPSVITANLNLPEKGQFVELQFRNVGEPDKILRISSAEVVTLLGHDSGERSILSKLKLTTAKSAGDQWSGSLSLEPKGGVLRTKLGEEKIFDKFPLQNSRVLLVTNAGLARGAIVTKFEEPPTQKKVVKEIEAEGAEVKAEPVSSNLTGAN